MLHSAEGWDSVVLDGARVEAPVQGLAFRVRSEQWGGTLPPGTYVVDVVGTHGVWRRETDITADVSTPHASYPLRPR